MPKEVGRKNCPLIQVTELDPLCQKPAVSSVESNFLIGSRPIRNHCHQEVSLLDYLNELPVIMAAENTFYLCNSNCSNKDSDHCIQLLKETETLV